MTFLNINGQCEHGFFSRKHVTEKISIYSFECDLKYHEIHYKFRFYRIYLYEHEKKAKLIVLQKNKHFVEKKCIVIFEKLPYLLTFVKQHLRHHRFLFQQISIIYNFINGVLHKIIMVVILFLKKTVFRCYLVGNILLTFFNRIFSSILLIWFDFFQDKPNL